MQLAPEQALFIRNMALPALEREHQTTVKVLEAIPADKANYQPDPNAKSAFDLAWHVATSENRLLEGVISGKFEFPQVEKAKTLTDVVAYYNDHFNKNIANLKAMTGEQLAQIVDFRGMMQLPAVAFLSLVMNHSIHHRGQLSVYLRPMGGKVPAIYGESYDSAEARQAAAKG